MTRRDNPKLISLSKNLRRKMTKEECHLWFDYLQYYPVKIRKQKVIGCYIVDFYCAAARLVIELDGSQHYTEDGQEKDRERDDYLLSQGLKVLRYSNYDFHRNFEGICTDIDQHIKERLK